MNAANTKGQTPLHLAASINRQDLATLLIEQGASINPRDEFKFTPLQVAAKEGYWELVSFLIDEDADITVQSGRTILELAATFGCPLKIVQKLIQKGHDADHNYPRVGLGPLYCAVAENRIDLATLLVKEGARFETIPPALILHACKSSNIKSSAFLLANGAKCSFVHEEILRSHFSKIFAPHPELIDVIIEAQSSPSPLCYLCLNVSKENKEDTLHKIALLGDIYRAFPNIEYKSKTPLDFVPPGNEEFKKEFKDLFLELSAAKLLGTVLAILQHDQPGRAKPFCSS